MMWQLASSLDWVQVGDVAVQLKRKSFSKNRQLGFENPTLGIGLIVSAPQSLVSSVTSSVAVFRDVDRNLSLPSMSMGKTTTESRSLMMIFFLR